MNANSNIPPNHFARGLFYGFVISLVVWAALFGMALFLLPVEAPLDGISIQHPAPQESNGP